MNQDIVRLPGKNDRKGPDGLITKMHRSVSVSLAVSVVCLTLLVSIGIFNFMIGDFLGGSLLLGGVLFLLWLHGGVYLYAPALLAFAKQYQRQDLFACKKTIVPYINLARSLPLRKDINVASLHNAVGVLHLHNGEYETALLALEEAVAIAEHKS